MRRRALDAGDEVGVAWKLISERLQPRESKALIAIVVDVKFTNATRSAREERRFAITFRVVLVEHTRTSPNNSVRRTSYFINRRVETLDDVVVRAKYARVKFEVKEVVKGGEARAMVEKLQCSAWVLVECLLVVRWVSKVWVDIGSVIVNNGSGGTRSPGLAASTLTSRVRVT